MTDVSVRLWSEGLFVEDPPLGRGFSQLIGRARSFRVLSLPRSCVTPTLVSGPVAGSLEAGNFTEGLGQDRSQRAAAFPVVGQSSFDRSEGTRGSRSMTESRHLPAADCGGESRRPRACPAALFSRLRRRSQGRRGAHRCFSASWTALSSVWRRAAFSRSAATEPGRRPPTRSREVRSQLHVRPLWQPSIGKMASCVRWYCSPSKTDHHTTERLR